MKTVLYFGNSMREFYDFICMLTKELDAHNIIYRIKREHLTIYFKDYKVIYKDINRALNIILGIKAYATIHGNFEIYNYLRIRNPALKEYKNSEAFIKDIIYNTIKRNDDTNK